MAGRIRPFKLPPLDVAQPFHFSFCAGGWHGFMHQWDLSFVSGHVAVAFATAAGLDQLLPTHRLFVWIAYGIALQLLIERVLENAHWLSDATCAAALGIGLAAVLARLTKLRQRMNIYG
jgi:membrane-associated phospholipid phosphatase